jgi:hypothetical protein
VGTSQSDTAAPAPLSQPDTAPPAPSSQPDTVPPAPLSVPVTSLAPPSTPPTTPLRPLATELVGTWQTSHWLDSTGSQQILRTYRFASDGHYDYQLAMCRSGATDCTIQGQESGYAQAVNGMLTLTPQTESQEGRRTWRYVVDRDPVVGDVRLVLTLPDGDEDIFYRD